MINGTRSSGSNRITIALLIDTISLLKRSLRRGENEHLNEE